MSQPESKPAGDSLTWAQGDGSADHDLTGVTLGDFQVERLLGRGGMGEVYLAIQTSLNRPVALKVLRADHLSRPAYLSRFEAEATAVAKLNHPNIVHVYTLGCVEGVRFIAMEYVQGTNLKDYILKKGALDLALAMSIMRQAGQAIGAAAEVGLIHRDIKPENLLLTKKGRVKVADFGLCRDLGAEELHLTQPGVTMGTPLYMSPEQAQGHPLDHRSDLYSLGVTFYYMIAGVPPFKAETALALAMKHVRDTPLNLRFHRPDLPVEVDRLVMKLMAKDPAQRFQSAAEMLGELSRIRDVVQGSNTVPASIEGLGLSTSLGSKTVEKAADATHTGTSVASTVAWVSESVRKARGLKLDRRAALLISTVMLSIGALAGWLDRPPDLLRAESPEATGRAGLWIEPAWKRIPRQADAQSQYRYAQLKAARDDLAAAWLAVPGYFPDAGGWSSSAYIQLGKQFWQDKDAKPISTLAADLARRTDGPARDRELAAILDVAVRLLREDLAGAVEGLDRLRSQLIFDPALVELKLEIVWDAQRLASRQGIQPVANRLRQIQSELAPRLFLMEGPAAGNRGGNAAN
jgi:serine/threonine-protein kinase